MKHLITLLLLLTTTTPFAQTATDASKVKETLKGASIAQPIIKTKTLFFSNAQKQDTIVLTVPPGPINKSNSSLIIKTFDNRIVYAESFKTYYFIHDIFQPATMPQGGQAAYESNVNKYIIALTKAKFEEHAKQKINVFLKDVAVSNTAVKRAKLYGKIRDQELYNAVITNPAIKIIWFPCLDCEDDDGARFFTYSAKKAKTIKFLETN